MVINVLANGLVVFCVFQEWSGDGLAVPLQNELFVGCLVAMFETPPPPPPPPPKKKKKKKNGEKKRKGKRI